MLHFRESSHSRLTQLLKQPRVFISPAYIFKKSNSDNNKDLVNVDCKFF